MKRPASRASLMSRMRALLRGYLLTHARLTHWKPRTVDKLDLGCVTLTECGDLCAAKYLLSLSKDQFKALMLERAKLKAKKTAVAGGKKEGTDKDAKAELKAERQRVQKICIELIKGNKGQRLRKGELFFQRPKVIWHLVADSHVVDSRVCGARSAAP